MDNELFELCKEVRERTGWEDHADNSISYHRTRSGEYELNNGKAAYHVGLDDPKLAFIPLYTSDYLLEKLPAGVSVKKNSGLSISYMATLELVKRYSKASDTPLKALLKLTIALHEAGELTDLVRPKGESDE